MSLQGASAQSVTKQLYEDLKSAKIGNKQDINEKDVKSLSQAVQDGSLSKTEYNALKEHYRSQGVSPEIFDQAIFSILGNQPGIKEKLSQPDISSPVEFKFSVSKKGDIAIETVSGSDSRISGLVNKKNDLSKLDKLKITDKAASIISAAKSGNTEIAASKLEELKKMTGISDLVIDKVKEKLGSIFTAKSKSFIEKSGNLTKEELKYVEDILNFKPPVLSQKDSVNLLEKAFGSQGINKNDFKELINFSSSFKILDNKLIGDLAKVINNDAYMNSAEKLMAAKSYAVIQDAVSNKKLISDESLNLLETKALESLRNGDLFLIKQDTGAHSAAAYGSNNYYKDSGIDLSSTEDRSVALHEFVHMLQDKMKLSQSRVDAEHQAHTMGTEYKLLEEGFLKRDESGKITVDKEKLFKTDPKHFIGYDPVDVHKEILSKYIGEDKSRLLSNIFMEAQLVKGGKSSAKEYSELKTRLKPDEIKEIEKLAKEYSIPEESFVSSLLTMEKFGFSYSDAINGGILKDNLEALKTSGKLSKKAPDLEYMINKSLFHNSILPAMNMEEKLNKSYSKEEFISLAEGLGASEQTIKDFSDIAAKNGIKTEDLAGVIQIAEKMGYDINNISEIINMNLFQSGLFDFGISHYLGDLSKPESFEDKYKNHQNTRFSYVPSRPMEKDGVGIDKKELQEYIALADNPKLSLSRDDLSSLKNIALQDNAGLKDLCALIKNLASKGIDSKNVIDIFQKISTTEKLEHTVSPKLLIKFLANPDITKNYIDAINKVINNPSEQNIQKLNERIFDSIAGKNALSSEQIGELKEILKDNKEINIKDLSDIIVACSENGIDLQKAASLIINKTKSADKDFSVKGLAEFIKFEVGDIHDKKSVDIAQRLINKGDSSALSEMNARLLDNVLSKSKVFESGEAEKFKKLADTQGYEKVIRLGYTNSDEFKDLVK